MRSRLHLIAVPVVASLLALGCTGPDEADAIEAALDEANGALTTSDEPAAFGDPEVASSAELVTTFADVQPMTAEAILVPGAKSYRVALLWGHLPAPDEGGDGDVAPEPIDWTGAISVDQGAIGVSRTLRFDVKDGLAPRTDPKVVSFTSRTRPAVDGLLLHVVVPGAGVLHFDTAALTADLDLGALAAGGTGAIPLGDGRNGLAIVGYEDQPGCARGLLLGRWVEVEPGLGRLRGRVVGGDGQLLGHVKGIWGHAPNQDADLFFGKYIDPDGAFQGLFGGTYGAGELEGHWGTQSPAESGRLVGRYFAGDQIAGGRGFWLGRWTEKCAQ